MATASPTTLPNVDVEVNFTDVITVTFDDLANGNLISVSADLNDFGVAISNTINTVTVTGKYSINIFDNKSIRHITRGSSDKIEQYQVAQNFNELNASRQVYNFSPDPRNSVIVTYTISTTEGDLTLTKTVFNEYSAGRDALKAFV
jgi:hypothetical protein